MSEKLQSGLAPNDPAGIEENTESRLLSDFIKANWTMSGTAVGTVDFGAHPSRTTKAITINCYRIFSSVYDKDVGSHAYFFDVPVAIDVYVRDAPARGKKDTVEQPSPKLVSIETYLRNFIMTNRLALRSKGINNIKVDRVQYPPEPADSQPVWSHFVLQVRMVYHLFRVPI